MADQAETVKTSITLSADFVRRIDRCAGLLDLTRGEAIEEAAMHGGIEKLEERAKAVAKAFVEGGDATPSSRKGKGKLK